MPWIDRTYRRRVRSDLVSFTVKVKETDLFLSAESDLAAAALAAATDARREIENRIAADPEFARSLTPLPLADEAPAIIREMLSAAAAAGVGPMAAVAGAVAERVGRALLDRSAQVIVENGGDLFIASTQPRTAAIFAGDSPLSERVGLIVKPDQTPLGVGASSGTVGPSLSLGRADAAIATARSAALADAAATALGNLVQSADDLPRALERAQSIAGVLGAVIIIGDQVGAWGEVELTPLDPERRQ
jgi:ApbE superfamily uncharacterized protein (UPF0280 family)